LLYSQVGEIRGQWTEHNKWQPVGQLVKYLNPSN
jgi:hypothetical protein